MTKTFDLCARAVFIALAVFVILRLWHFFSPRPIDSYVHGGLIGAEQSETLFTGFATIPVLYFYANGELVQFNPTAAGSAAPGSVNGFCYHLYDVAIGYEDIAQTLAAARAQDGIAGWTIPAPEVLAGNVVESRHGGALSRYACDELDLAPDGAARDARKQRLVAILKTNRQWAAHRENAQAILLGIDAGLAKLAAEQKAKTTTLSADEPPTIAAAGVFSAGRADRAASPPTIGASGALGSLKLTFSTIALFTRDKNWFFQKNEFYVRQDNAEVTYGAEFYHEFTAQRRFLAPSSVTLTLPTPRALAIDRFTLALKAHPAKFDPTSKHHGKNEGGDGVVPLDPIERALTAELQRQMARVEPQAIMISKGLIVDQIRALMRTRDADVVVKFERDTARRNDEAFEILQRLSRTENDGEQASIAGN